MREDI